ncbi:MAG: prepilin peptidase [Deltaproteobacteria bacterium]|nr:prepilin peptidase [Deltaproteobacteria bacterium]MCL5893135.1 prepilin peptidase [Deltaproteobacteria bacterium]
MLFKRLNSKRIFILPVLAVTFGILILYPFFTRNLSDIYYAVETAVLTRRLIVPDGLNLKYLVLFSGLILLSLTDMLFERISGRLAIFLVLAGFLFAYLTKTPLLSPLEALGIGAGVFILIDIAKLGSYAFGDILTAGAIGAFVGIENIVIISICAIILGKIIAYLGARLDGLFDKSRVKQFHFAFVPVLFLVAAVMFAV